MFEVKEVRLEGFSVPPEAIGMVVMQPYVELQSPDPYRWPEPAADRQLRRIERTLSIAKQATHGCEKTHFTIFPEYAIPGLRGVQLIGDIVGHADWPDGTVVIGGTDWLNKEEFHHLWSAPSTVTTDGNKTCGDDQSVNCCIIWAKRRTPEGAVCVTRWLQPKLCPNWLEERINVQQMFEGDCLYVFEVETARQGRPFRFVTVLCFDWVGPLNGGRGSAAILTKLNDLRAEGRYAKTLDLAIVPQRNPKPNHASFLDNTYSFFVSQGYGFVNRDKCVVVFANNAGADEPGTCWHQPGPCAVGKYGYTSLIFHPSAAFESSGTPPSYSVATVALRGSDVLRNCHDALFRENGACIHSFRLHHPLSVAGAPDDRRRPLCSARVYAIDDGVRDPRVAGLQIPALVKWVCDRVEKLTPYTPPSEVLTSKVGTARRAVMEGLKWRKPGRLADTILHGTSGMKRAESTGIDAWTDRQERSLKDVIDVLSVVGCAANLAVKEAPTHASFVAAGTVVDVVVVSGSRHQENLAHAAQFYPGRMDRRTLIVSCDQDDNPLTDRDGPVYAGRGKDETQSGKTAPVVIRCGWHNIKSRLDGATEDGILTALRVYLRIDDGHPVSTNN